MSEIINKILDKDYDGTRSSVERILQHVGIINVRYKNSLNQLQEQYEKLNEALIKCVEKKKEIRKENSELIAERKKLSSEFWKDTAKLIELYRKEGDNRAAEGVLECRVLFNRLNSERSNETNPKEGENNDK